MHLERCERWGGMLVGTTGSDQGGKKPEWGCRKSIFGGSKAGGRSFHVLGGTWEELEIEIKGGNDGGG